MQNFRAPAVTLHSATSASYLFTVLISTQLLLQCTQLWWTTSVAIMRTKEIR